MTDHTWQHPEAQNSIFWNYSGHKFTHLALSFLLEMAKRKEKFLFIRKHWIQLRKVSELHSENAYVVPVQVRLWCLVSVSHSVEHGGNETQGGQRDLCAFALVAIIQWGPIWALGFSLERRHCMHRGQIMTHSLAQTCSCLKIFKWNFNENVGLVFSWIQAGSNRFCPVKRTNGMCVYPNQ